MFTLLLLAALAAPGTIEETEPTTVRKPKTETLNGILSRDDRPGFYEQREGDYQVKLFKTGEWGDESIIGMQAVATLSYRQDEYMRLLIRKKGVADKAPRVSLTGFYIYRNKAKLFVITNIKHIPSEFDKDAPPPPKIDP